MQLQFNIAGFNRETLKENGPGFAVSAVLHALLAIFVLWFVSHPSQVTQTVSHILPVDIVHLADETQSPPAPVKARVPQQASAPRGQPSSLAPAGVSHDEKKPLPEDAFDAKLHALSQLRQPDAKRPLDNAGVDTDTVTTGEDGNSAAYAVRDYVRQQILRHWNLDYSMLGDRKFSVAIRIVMTNHGVITLADIVDKVRFRTDPIYHEIALSARNAATLSSPIPLPVGNYREEMDFTLSLNPRDTNR